MKKIFALFISLFMLLSGCQGSSQPGAPTIISTSENKQMNKPQVLNIAHRGARSIAPENTILAAQKGLGIGADLWELDVALSADGTIVVIHDDTLVRTSNASEIFPDRRPWKIEDFTLSELLSLDFGSWFVKTDPFKTISSGVVSTEEVKSFTGIKMPSLKEALQFTKDNRWRVNIEIKDLTGKPGDTSIVEKVVALVKEMGMDKQVIISSFNHTYLERAKKADAGLSTAALVNKPDKDPVALVESLGASAYNPNVQTLDYAQIAPLRQKGKDIFVWTVNDEATMKKLIDAGVTGIFTDFPQLLKKILE